MGSTWPNLGPRCAPDSLTLLNTGPTKSQSERERERKRGPSPAHTQTQIGRRPAVRRKLRAPATGPCPCRRPSVVTEGYIRSPPLPPTLLLDRGDTPGRPQVDLRSNPVDRFICYLLVFLRVMWKTSFFTVFRGLWRTRLSPNRAPAASVTRAARTGLIDISWVLGT